jgi:predicted ATP-grasp superfamily ATP-dependent carboligase
MCIVFLAYLFLFGWACYGVDYQLNEDGCAQYPQTETLNLIMKIMCLYILFPLMILCPCICCSICFVAIAKAAEEEGE